MPWRGGKSVRFARAFAPGHVTGFFSPALQGRDPRSRGSLGAGIVLEVGARAEAVWRPGDRKSLSVTSRESEDLPVSREVAEHLVGARTGSLRVSIEHELPIGVGLGMSAAGALATALAVASAVGERRNRAIEVAHLADLFGGGGLGGVAAILGGGLERRIEPGVPPWGRVLHAPYRGAILLIFGGAALPSRSLLLRPAFRRRASLAAATAISAFARGPTHERFWSESERFTDALQLANAPLLRLLRNVRGTGARAAQAMLGRTLFAEAPAPAVHARLVDLLERNRVSAVELRAGSRGAALLGTASPAPAQAL
jgi:pantoate kinase